jgi:hypothetical protein
VPAVLGRLPLASPGRLDPCRDQGLDLARRGEASGLLLREDELAVQLDVEDAASALDQRGAEPEPLLQLVRQTGGAGEIISGYAVLDGKVVGHIDVLLSQSVCLAYNANVYAWQCVNIFEWR